MYVRPWSHAHHELIPCLFVVNVESEGAYPPERLLPEAIHVFRNKIDTIREAALSLRAEDVEMNN